MKVILIVNIINRKTKQLIYSKCNKLFTDLQNFKNDFYKHIRKDYSGNKYICVFQNCFFESDSDYSFQNHFYKYHRNFTMDNLKDIFKINVTHQNSVPQSQDQS